MVKKQTFIKTVSVLLVVILAIAVFAVLQNQKINHYATLVKNQYSSAFEQLNSSLNNISTSMQKVAYVSSAKKMSSLSSEIFSEAELAKTALSKLPMGEENISTIYRFLSQVGNYAISVSKDMTSENTVSAKQREELKILGNTAQKITQVISDTATEYNTPEKWARAIEHRLNNAISENGLAESLIALEEDLSDYPTLIYDGPYSDHILQKQPLMTTSAKEVTQQEALQKAKNMLGGGIDLQFQSMQLGKIECYRFGNNDVNIAVSKAGGYVLYMRKNRDIKETLLSYEQALLKAKRFLEQNNIKNMTDTYFFTDNGVCVINFAYLDGQTICYTDLIKVGVAMDTGEVMLYEAAGYLTNHTERSFKVAHYTKEEAAEKISPDLQIKDVAIALIPTDSGGEVRCYQFLCDTQDGQEILIYINTLSLEEEQIYILLKNDGGTLVK